MSDVSEKIAKLLEDPESIKMISELAGRFIGNNNEKTQEIIGEVQNVQENDTSTELVTEKIAENSSAVSSAVNKLLEGADIENTVKLVSALKPYMSKRRRDSADSVLKMLGIMKLVGNSNFAEMAKLLGK